MLNAFSGIKKPLLMWSIVFGFIRLRFCKCWNWLEIYDAKSSHVVDRWDLIAIYFVSTSVNSLNAENFFWLIDVVHKILNRLLSFGEKWYSLHLYIWCSCQFKFEKRFMMWTGHEFSWKITHLKNQLFHLNCEFSFFKTRCLHLLTSIFCCFPHVCCLIYIIKSSIRTCDWFVSIQCLFYAS